MTSTADDTLAFAGPGALAELVRAGEVHPRELVELCLRRIEALDPRLNAFRVTLAEQALAEAHTRVGHSGPLAGVPFAVKDDLALAGQSTTRGSRGYGPPAAQDSEVVRRLRAAGAIPVGVTNVPELMIWPWTVSAANGVTRNPWDPSRTPGGSSGGSAAAVAAGMVPFATASDGGGSIRIPAACCGLVGMKPSRGRVSARPASQGWLGLSTYGALARTVADSALLLDAIHGTVPGDADAAPPFAGSYVEAARTPPQPLRVAVSTRLPPGALARVCDEQRGACQSTAELLRGLGHEVVQRTPAYGTVALDFVQTWLRGVYEESGTVPDRSALEGLTRRVAGLGRVLVPPRRRDRVVARRSATTARIVALWNEIDVLLTPVLTRTAIGAQGAYERSLPVAFDRSGRFIGHNPAFNVTGQPAIALPAGVGRDGLPLSVQLVARPGGEDLLFSLAGQIEAARPWTDRRPAIA